MSSIFDSIHFSSETIHPSTARRSSRGVTAAATIYNDKDHSPQRTIAFVYEPRDSENEQEGDGLLIAYSTPTNASTLVEFGSVRIPNGIVSEITVTPRFVENAAILLLLPADGSNIVGFQVVWNPESEQISFLEEHSFTPGPESFTTYQNCALQMHPIHRVVALGLNKRTSDSVLQLVALLPSDGGGGDTTKLATTIVLEDCCCTDVSWSSNGEYLAIASNSGATAAKDKGEANVMLYRYDPLNASSTKELLTLAATIPKQSSGEDEVSDSWKCTFVHWLDALSLMVGYNTITHGLDESPLVSLHVWDIREGSLQVISSTDLGDVIPFFDVLPGQQHTFYVSTLAKGTLGNELPMPLVFVAANVGNDVALIGKDASSSAWSILEMEDSGLSTPVNEDDDFSFPTGIQLMSTGQLFLAATDASLSLYTPPHELSLSFLSHPLISEEPSWNSLLETSTTVPVPFAEADTPTSVLDFTEISDDEPPEMSDEPEEGDAIPEPDADSALPAPLLPSVLSPSMLSATVSLNENESLSLPPDLNTHHCSSESVLNPPELPLSIDGSADAVAVTDPDVVVLPTAIADVGISSTLAPPEIEMSETAAKAAKVFDELDGEEAGSLPSHRMEELLDALGEGFHGTELDDQVAIIDPASRGMLDRTAFIAWYVRLSSPHTRNEDDGSDASSSIDSEEKADREEERENARRAFDMISSDEGSSIEVSDFPKLIESLNTTYCDEDHGKVSRKLRKGDKIYIDDFLDWYVDWIFGDDESTDADDENTEPLVETPVSGWGDVFSQKEGSWKCENCMVSNDAIATECAACSAPRHCLHDTDNAEPVSTKVLASGWGDTFPQKSGSWKCESCMVTNFAEQTECVACSTPRPGYTKPTEINAELPAAALESTIESGGFFFGAAPAAVANLGVSTATSLENLKDIAVADSTKKEPSTGSSVPVLGAGGFFFGTQPTSFSSAGAGGFTFGTELKESGVFGSSLDLPKNAKVTTEEGNVKEEESIKAVDVLKTSFQFSALSFPQKSSEAPEMATAATCPPMSQEAPALVGLSRSTKTAPVAAAPPLSTAVPSPVKPIEKSAVAFPPMSWKAPTPIGLPQSTTAALSADAPAMSMVAPSPSKSSKKSAAAAAAFPPMSLKAPTPIELSRGTRAAPVVAAPPISTVVPSPIKPNEKSAVAFPPMSLKAPTPIALPQDSKAAPVVAPPPKSMVAPSPIKSSEKSAVAFLPMSMKAPTPMTTSSNRATNLSSFAWTSTPLSPDTIPETTSSFLNEGPAVGFQSARAHSPNKSLPSNFTMSSFMRPISKAGAPFPTADTKEDAKLSEYSQEYAYLVGHMHKSLHLLAINRPSVNKTDKLRNDIESQIESLSAARVDIIGLFRSLEEWKRTAASVLGRKTEATRNVIESQRLIDELWSPGHKTFDDFSTEPLDFQSETRRRKLSARFMVTKRLLDISKSRHDLISAMVSPQGGNALLASILSSYNDVKEFDEAASKVERKVTEIASSQIHSSSTKASSIVTRQSSMYPVRNDKLASLRDVDRSLRTLETPAVKVFDLNHSSWRDDRKASTSHTLATPRRGSFKTSLFSPSMSLKARDGWFSSSTANQMKMKQVSFSVPGELRETTLSFSSRDALSDFGTNPDKVQELLTVNKRGMQSIHNVAMSTFETSAKFSASTLKRQTAPLNSGGIGPTSSQIKSASSYLSGRDSALPNEADAGESAEGSVSALSLSSTPKKGTAQPPVDSASNRSASLNVGNTPFFGSNLLQQFSSSPKEEILSQATLDPGEPDFHRLLTRFYEQHNPDKIIEASNHLEKYKVCY
jgi:Zn-finger in Ran binding protein and others